MHDFFITPHDRQTDRQLFIDQIKQKYIYITKYIAYHKIFGQGHTLSFVENASMYAPYKRNTNRTLSIRHLHYSGYNETNIYNITLHDGGE